ncbi:MAG: hypothetical protein JW908_05405 [Anaerolineales bacterium]|nr:hypothetical protein [Anaerolineales bacterium]
MSHQVLTRKRFLWKILRIVILFLLAITSGFPPTIYAQGDDISTPSTVVRLVFIHHSCGENWLSDEHGGLGLALGENNYYVSDTNYGWGPDSIGDRTDIVDWQEWFRSAQSPRYLSALFTENGQNSSYTRNLSDPGGENEIILFKSCFPNSNIEGDPNDPAAAGDGLTVSNARYIYNDLLNYFITRPDKLFIVITAPPVQDASLAENARAFNTWLVNDWLEENQYPYPNVAVFDFYNVLSGENNHHRYNQGVIEYIIDQGGNTSAYPSAPDDDHPSAQGNSKATAEFVPLLNIYYHRWRVSDSAQTQVTPQAADASAPEIEPSIEGLPMTFNGLIDDFETVVVGGDAWQFYFDGATDSVMRCAVDRGMVYQGNTSLKIEFDIAPASWGTCTLPYGTVQDWRSGSGIGFYLHADQADQVFSLLAQGGTPENRTSYAYVINVPQESLSGWAYIQVPWDQLRRVAWEDNAGSPFDPGQTTAIAFAFDGLPEARTSGVIWVDNIHVLGISGQATPGEAESGEPAVESSLPETQPEEEEEQDQGRGGCCRGIAFIPLPVLGLMWLNRRVKASN